jgi:hypothetical protein
VPIFSGEKNSGKIAGYDELGKKRQAPPENSPPGTVISSRPKVYNLVNGRDSELYRKRPRCLAANLPGQAPIVGTLKIIEYDPHIGKEQW